MQAYVPGILGCISKSANMQILIMYTSKGADMKAVCVCVYKDGSADRHHHCMKNQLCRAAMHAACTEGME